MFFRSVIVLSALFAQSAFAGTLTPRQGQTVEVKIETLERFSQEDAAKVNQAAELMQRVLNSTEFRDEVLSFTWNGSRQFADNDGQSNEKIFQTILDGSETLKPGIDHTANLYLHLDHPPFWKRWSEVGHTDPDVLTIFMNWNYFNIYELADIADNLTHEWMHKLGYDHDYRRTAKRPFSVPYGVGDIVDKLGRRLLDLPPSAP